MDQRVELAQAPVERGVAVLVPHAVEPDGPHLAVLGEQLGELRLHEVEIGVGVLLFRGAARAEARAAARSVLAPPVDERVVEVEADALAVALVRQLLHHVAGEGGRLDDVVGRLRRAEHREALVVARGEADVAGARLAEGRDPLARVEACGIEARGELLVLAVVEVGVGHVPLALPEHGVEPPMEEDAEAAVGELLPRGEVLGCGSVAGLRREAAQAAERGQKGGDSFHFEGLGLSVSCKDMRISRNMKAEALIIACAGACLPARPSTCPIGSARRPPSPRR